VPAARNSQNAAPEEFTEALEQLRAITVRPEIELAEAPAPQRLAPHALAMTADVVLDDEDAASGRLVVLYDPAGQDAWEGQWRVVVFARARLEPEMAADPMMSDVGQVWLEEALVDHGAALTAYGGTVTRTHSQPFGAMSGREVSGDLELRASWTPRDGDLAPHVAAWLQLLATMAGLEPVVEGVTTLHR
jgi:hypothetical protein